MSTLEYDRIMVVKKRGEGWRMQDLGGGDSSCERHVYILLALEHGEKQGHCPRSYGHLSSSCKMSRKDMYLSKE